MRRYKLLLGFLICTIHFAATSQNKPNFIFVLTDDQPYGYLGCTGNDIVRTPNIDKIANEGVLFTNAHVTSAICTPSRVSILLSQYERKHNVNFNSGTSVALDAWNKSYPVIMRNAGYYSGWVGKNHAPVGKGGYSSGVMESSFDYWYAGHGHLGFYPKEKHEIFNDAIADTQVEIIQEGVNDFLDPNERRLNGAIHFLEHRPEDKPFILSINFNLPHGASTSTMEMRSTDDSIYKTLYRDIEIPLPINYVAKKDITTPKLPADLFKVDERQDIYDYVDKPSDLKERYIRQLAAMTGIDRLIGRLRAKLKEVGVAENTIIIFTSDHGLFMGENGIGGKALCYEKTTHVPLIVLDPRLPKTFKGRKIDALVQTIDIAPTILSMAGIKKPSVFQGKDISAILNNKKQEVRDYLYTENLWSTQFGNPRCESIQNKKFKYIRYYANKTFPASKKIEIAKELGLPIAKMLYTVHDTDIAIYRDYVESPLRGEQPVYEELYDLERDPTEQKNIIEDPNYNKDLEALKVAWSTAIKEARTEEEPKVFRYTVESQYELNQKLQLE
ncbi:sulfatase-like hydrolase/transferase [Joostella atrarenae]|uniref:Sulfatase-like hydrolase/transferase n=1 Tax=Joostella atrarenae TaxID=679257 RepID=A0ABS9J720_9FLAO|nr:sulfatase-like hydrolase/transferase [Joostella atrarenae]MCF8716236.1 sulfatase-like hydrolase/transferase [Joostella atrarenae]